MSWLSLLLAFGSAPFWSVAKEPIKAAWATTSGTLASALSTYKVGRYHIGFASLVAFAFMVFVSNWSNRAIALLVFLMVIRCHMSTDEVAPFLAAQSLHTIETARQLAMAKLEAPE